MGLETDKKVDILAFSAHPDDAELSCSGTLAKYISLGKKVAIVDLTEGEMGTRGTIETRRMESANASSILGIHFRENLQIADCGIQNNQENQLKLIRIIRTYRPEVVLCNAPTDRHPDHGKAALLQLDACFYSGLAKILTTDSNGMTQNAFRPKLVFHYIQDQWLQPDLVIDISEYFEKKLESIRAFKTQFFDPNSNEPSTYISDEKYFDYIRSRSSAMGHMIGVRFGEGYIKRKMIGLNDFSSLL